MEEKEITLFSIEWDNRGIVGNHYDPYLYTEEEVLKKIGEFDMCFFDSITIKLVGFRKE